MAITLRQIQAFLAVTEQGTFTKAAERLHMAQPALSQLVRELERELGIRVLDRTTRRVELTEGGREFHGAAVKILTDLDTAVENANGLAERRRGRIVVAVPPLLAAVIMPPAIAALRGKHPGLQVTILDARNDLVVEAVRFGKADCGIGTFSALEDNIERLPLARDSLMLFCGRDSGFAGREAVAWRELAEEELVTLTRDSGIRLLVEVGYESAQITLRPAYEVAQITTALALVEAGLGIAVLPTYARAVAPTSIVAKPLVEPAITRDIVMIRPSGRSVPPALSAFEALLRRFVRERVPSEA
ncbi:LysR family transcriptional regulator [Bosea minatitlanensis]|uniref:LysR family transcriptional regulator n=1 Tax=Bosea minatitlanensis TaxID=128782 RepID=A0ABW0F3N0_9HYPH|nr:LysR family transcriptional regulator [Bosea minatitlanensis]MCT4494055.1 LysR family transcriptional regulator [Bosea minatitlanensis]